MTTSSEPRPGWQRSTTCKVNGRHLTPGTEFTVRGQGRFRFQEHVTTDDGAEWLYAIGGKSGVVMFRAFRPERVQRVHRVAKTRTNAR